MVGLSFALQLEAELRASENDVRRKRQEVADQERLVQACQQRVETKREKRRQRCSHASLTRACTAEEQVNELKRRVLLASGSRQAADEEARSQVNLKRADAMLEAIGCIYTT